MVIIPGSSLIDPAIILGCIYQFLYISLGPVRPEGFDLKRSGPLNKSLTSSSAPQEDEIYDCSVLNVFLHKTTNLFVFVQ